MALGIIGQKCGMTRIYNEAGTAIPVTVIAAEANRITQVKTLERDGYRAIQVTKGSQKRNRISKALAGIYKKAGVESGQGLWEFRLEASEGEALALRLQEALNSLDPIDREILSLRHFEQLSRAEAAQVLGIEEGTAAKRYFRALKRLKDTLADMPGGLEGL